MSEYIDTLQGAVSNVRSWLSQAGFSTAPRSRPHRLGTTDLVGDDLAVRVQRDRPPVDRVELHLLRLDNPTAESLAFFSDVDFTEEALDSDELEVALFNYDEFGLLTPRNTKAFELIVAVADGHAPVSSRPVAGEPAPTPVLLEDDGRRDVEPNVAALCLIITVLATLAIGPWFLVRLDNIAAEALGWVLIAGFALLGFVAATALLGGVREIAASRPGRTVFRQAVTSLIISTAFGVAGYLLTRLGHGVLSSAAWVLFIPNAVVLLLTAVTLCARRKPVPQDDTADAPADLATPTVAPPAPAQAAATPTLTPPPAAVEPETAQAAREEHRVIDLTAYERKSHHGVRRRVRDLDQPADED